MATTTGSLDHVRLRVLERQYTEERGRGFRLTSIDPESLVGRYFERHERVEHVQHPSMEVVEHRITDYRITNFMIDLRSGRLECQDPARSIKAFVDELQEMCHRQFELSEPPVLVWDWALALRSRCDAVEFSSMEFTSVPVTPAVAVHKRYQGTIPLERAEEWIAESGCERLAMVELLLRQGGNLAKVVLTRSGGAKFLSYGSSAEVSLLRSALYSCWDTH